DIRKLVRDAVAAKARAEKAQIKREKIQMNRAAGKGVEAVPPSAEAGSEDPPPGPVGPEIQNRSIRLLCRGLLTEPTVRDAVASGPAPGFFRQLAETELLSLLWTGDFDPASAASVNAFVGRLPENERSTA